MRKFLAIQANEYDNVIADIIKKIAAAGWYTLSKKISAYGQYRKYQCILRVLL